MTTFKRSMGFAINGIRKCFNREAHFKIHSVSAILVIGAGYFFRVSTVEWIILLICIAAVLASELINTAIEELCNIVHKEEHAGIKLVKDMAAAAVLVTALSAVIIGTIIFFPKIILFIKP